RMRRGTRLDRAVRDRDIVTGSDVHLRRASARAVVVGVLRGGVVLVAIRLELADVASVAIGLLELIVAIELASQLANMRPGLGDRPDLAVIDRDIIQAEDVHRGRAGGCAVVVGVLRGGVVLVAKRLGLADVASVARRRLALRVVVALLSVLPDLHFRRGNRLDIAVGPCDRDILRGSDAYRP